MLEGQVIGDAAEGIGRQRRDYASGLQHEHYAEAEARNYDGMAFSTPWTGRVWTLRFFIRAAAFSSCRYPGFTAGCSGRSAALYRLAS